MQEHLRSILLELGLDIASEGLKRTPLRIATVWQEWMKGNDMEVKLERTYTEKSEMVCARDIPFMSMCEHHFLPFYGKCHIAYIPNGFVTGLSKLDGLVTKHAKRFTIQERMTENIASELQKTLRPYGTMVVTEAVHTCKIAEGYHGGSYLCSVLKGVFLVNEGPREEARDLMGLRR